jgi:hypothetical protein
MARRIVVMTAMTKTTMGDTGNISDAVSVMQKLPHAPISW